MEIHGYDLEVPCGDVPAALTRVASWLSATWPEGLVEDDTPGFSIALAYPDVFRVFLPVPAGDSLFVYRDWAAKRAWDEHGWTPEQAEGLVMIGVDTDGLCLTTETCELAEALRGAIERTT